MKLTNNFNLPDTIVNVIRRPQYDKGDSQISATEILSSPRIVQLKRKHWDQLTEDCADMVWSLFGSAVHNVLQHGKDDHHIVEERVFIEFEGWKISGAIDLQEVYEDGTVISDYKVTSAWTVMNEKSDWHNQLNLYAWLLRMKGKTVKALQIVAIVRDWNRRDAKMREGYPSAPVTVISIPLWTFEDQTAYIKKRLTLHNDAFFASHINEGMPLCTPEDMWEKPTVFAIMKEGGKRAKSVHSTREEADENLPAKGYFVEVREGSRTRCESFCQVAEYCDQFKQYKLSKETQ